MKIAIPIWQGRVSPVLDVASNLLVVTVADGKVHGRAEVALAAGNPLTRVEALTGLKLDVLVCGAISRPLAQLLADAGIAVIPRICGDIECVLAAYLSDNLMTDEFMMPGCCGQRWGFQRRHHGGGR